MRKVKAIKKSGGRIRFHLASTSANNDWIASARLLKEGKTEELKNLDSEPMFYANRNSRKARDKKA